MRRLLHLSRSLRGSLADNPFQVRLYFEKPWFSETFKGWAYVTLIGNHGKTQRTILNEYVNVYFCF